MAGNFQTAIIPLANDDIIIFVCYIDKIKETLYFGNENIYLCPSKTGQKFFPSEEHRVSFVGVIYIYYTSAENPAILLAETW